MIIEIPTSDEFQRAGLGFLNLAVDQVIELYDQLERSGVEEDVREEYWKSAQQPLATALTLVQQGAEFLLKAKIADVSAFLLIDGSPNSWPRGCDQQDTPFSDFRTIDAQDLPKAHDAVASVRLSEEFKTQFEELRRRRNTIMHSLDQSLELTAESVLKAALSTVHTLADGIGWIDQRRRYLEVTPTAAAFSSDHVEPVIISEVQTLLGVLTRSEAIEVLGFDKRRRHYICPTCKNTYEWDDLDPMTAVLDPNTPRSTHVYCFVCAERNEVVRRKCPDEECPGNVMSDEARICLTCGQYLPYFD